MSGTETTKPATPKPAAAPAPDVTTPTPDPALTVDTSNKKSKQEPVYALHRINGTIEPGTLFRPANANDRKELEQLEAVRELTEAEAAIFEKTEAAGDDVLG